MVRRHSEPGHWLMRARLLVQSAALSSGLLATSPSAPRGSGCPSAPTVRVVVHYMLWFSPEHQDGHWHWYPKGSFDPLTDGCNNTEHLATWFPPSTGAFASDSVAHIASDMALLKEHCIDGIIMDYQNPTAADDPSKQAIAAAFPLVLQAAVANNLSWAVMYDTSSKAGGNWGRDDPTVAADWAEIIQTAADFRESTLKDAGNNTMFFAFGATPMPAAGVSCENCSFYVQDGRGDTGAGHAPGQHGAFAWIEPQASSQYLPGFYEGKCAKAYPGASTPCVGVAYAGFKAVYPQYGAIARSTELLRSTLELCGSKAELCQVATWNDFNEGTHVQPSWWCDGNAPDAFLQAIKDFKTGLRRAE